MGQIFRGVGGYAVKLRKTRAMSAEKPGTRIYNRRGGRPGLNVDFTAVCDAVLGAWRGNGDTVTDVAERFGVSRGWVWKWVYPALGREKPGS